MLLAAVLLLLLLHPTSPLSAPTTTSSSPPSASSISSISCPHFTTCSGCTNNTTLLDIPIIKSAANFFASPSIVSRSSSSLKFTLTQPTPAASYRTLAKLAPSPAHPFLGGCKFGLYKAGSHEVLSITDCVVHHPSINYAIEILERATKKCKTTAYVPAAPAGRKAKKATRSTGNLKSGEGSLRYVSLAVDPQNNTKVSLTLVWNAPTLAQAQPSLSHLTKALKGEPLFDSVWVNFNDRIGNAIINTHAASWKRLSGNPYLRAPFPNNKQGYLYVKSEARVPH